MTLQHVETSAGVLAYRRAGGGEPVLLLHGGLSDSRSWLAQLTSLAGAYDVVAWDAPGCGGSADPAAALGLADYAAAVVALVTALELGPVHLVGHSFGSGLALAVQAACPGLVRSLVLSGAYAGWRGSLTPEEVDARLRQGLAYLHRPPEEWADAYLATFLTAAAPRETVEAARSMLRDVRPAGVRSMLQAFAAADLRGVLPKVGVPTLLVHGADDVRSTRPVVDALQVAIPGSCLVVVPDVGHDVNLEAPDAFHAAVLAFLCEVG